MDCNIGYFHETKKDSLLIRGRKYFFVHGSSWLSMAINYYFEWWKADGTFEKIDTRLNQLDTQRELRASTPWLVWVDSWSVELNPMIEKDRGIDAAMELVTRGYLFEKSAHLTEMDKTTEQLKKGKKFVVESRRWVVVRSFAWTNRTGDPVLSQSGKRL